MALLTLCCCATAYGTNAAHCQGVTLSKAPEPCCRRQGSWHHGGQKAALNLFPLPPIPPVPVLSSSCIRRAMKFPILPRYYLRNVPIWGKWGGMGAAFFWFWFWWEKESSVWEAQKSQFWLVEWGRGVTNAPPRGGKMGESGGKWEEMGGNGENGQQRKQRNLPLLFLHCSPVSPQFPLCPPGMKKIPPQLF